MTQFFFIISEIGPISGCVPFWNFWIRHWFIVVKYISNANNYHFKFWTSPFIRQTKTHTKKKPKQTNKKKVFTVTQPTLFFHLDIKNVIGKFIIPWKFSLPLEPNGLISSITVESVIKTVNKYTNITNNNF